ncbi:hypothetical protein ACFX14_029143 [Malus domestica]
MSKISKTCLSKNFSRETLCLFFLEGEYGVVDIFYAAAKSKNVEFFRLLFLLCGFAKQLQWRSRNTLSATAMPHSPAISQVLRIIEKLLFWKVPKGKATKKIRILPCRMPILFTDRQKSLYFGSLLTVSLLEQ